jgi:CRP-like cAMP-binding protein
MLDSVVIPLAQPRPGLREESTTRLARIPAEATTRRHFSAREHLFFQGDRPSGIFEILSGTAILYSLTADGRRQIQDFVSAGDVVALCFGEEHNLSAEALTELDAVHVARAVFERALQDNSDFRRDIFALIDRTLQRAREQSLFLGLKSAMERSASFLLFIDSRFGAGPSGFVPIRMSRSDIADHLGLTLETVSRMLNQLKQSGVIDLPRPDQFRIIDRRRLAALAGEIDATDALTLYG